MSIGIGTSSFTSRYGQTLFVGGLDGHLYAIDFRSGQLLWGVRSESYIIDSVALSGTIAYYGTNLVGNFAEVAAVDTSVPHLLWRRHVGSQVSATPAVAYGLVYVVSEDNNIYAFDPQTGHLQWSAPNGAGKSVSVADGIVFEPTETGTLHALDAMTGDQLWSFAPGGRISKVAVADGTIYFGNDTALFAMRVGSSQQP